jgi:hypothetical protein
MSLEGPPSYLHAPRLVPVVKMAPQSPYARLAEFRAAANGDAGHDDPHADYPAEGRPLACDQIALVIPFAGAVRGASLSARGGLEALVCH